MHNIDIFLERIVECRVVSHVSTSHIICLRTLAQMSLNSAQNSTWYSRLALFMELS